MVYRDDEQMIEGLYWEFDKRRSEKTRTERDIFKGKLRWALANAPSRGNDFAAIAQALNWERTEFDTLDELLEELQATARVKYDELSDALHNRDRVIRAAREMVRQANEMMGAHKVTFMLDEIEAMLSAGPSGFVEGGHDADMREPVEQHAGFAEGGYVKELPGRGVAAVLRPTHTLLHAGELYREVTILLHTEQLVAWRTADGQEYSAPAHQVLLDPDEDGLAAAILSRIAGVEIAPEHMAELRAQMDGGVK